MNMPAKASTAASRPIHPVRRWWLSRAVLMLAVLPGLASAALVVRNVYSLGDDHPRDLALTADGGTLYVATFLPDDATGGKVKLLTVATGASSGKEIAVGGDPQGIAMAPREAAGLVTGAGDDGGLVRFSTAKLETTKDEKLAPEASGVAYAPDGKMAFVATAGAAGVSVIDAHWGAVDGTVSGLGKGGYRVAVTPNGRFVYVTGRNRRLYKVDATARTAGKPIPADGWDVAVSPDGKLVYVSGGDKDAAIKVVSAASDEVQAVFDVGFFPRGLAVSPDGKTIYATLPKNQMVAAIDAESGKVLSTVRVGSYPTRLVIAPDGRSLFVANEGEASIAVVDLASATVPAESAAAAGPSRGPVIEVPPAGVAATPPSTLAVSNFEAQGMSASAAAIAADWMRSELVRVGSFKVLERKNMDAIMAEQAVQQTGCTDQDCAVKLGKMLNVDRMALGSMGKFEDSYVVMVRVVSVESGQVIWSGTARGRTIDDVDAGIRQLAQAVSKGADGKEIRDGDKGQK